MRTVEVITVARSDYGIYLPLLKILNSDSDIKLRLVVTGMHLSPEFGMTVNTIISDGFPVSEKFEMLLSSDSEQGVGKSIGLGVINFAQSFAQTRPDILVVLGDRFEMLTAALAALPFKIPVAHIHGGECTQGAFDDAIRHSITKLSHLHFVSTKVYAQRVVQLGEEPWRVFVSGAPSLDNIDHINILAASELETRFNLQLTPSPILVTFHPVTLESEQTEWQIGEVLAALEKFDTPIIFTLPNADTNGRLIISKINEFLKKHSNALLINNFGSQAYFSLMLVALAMVGNSSSGIIEAPSFKLPCVNIGNRQKGRVFAENVIQSGYLRSDIENAIRKAISPEFHNKLQGMINPYKTGNASELISEKIKTITLDEKLVIKSFFDFPPEVLNTIYE